MTVTREFTGVLGMLIAAVTGGGYYYSANGDRDFTVEIGRSPEDVHAAFSDIRRTSRGMRDFGVVIPPIEELHPSPNELVFTMESVNPGQPSRIGFSFAPGSGPVSTVVTVAVDVPPIRYGDKILSEDKVEDKFREAVQALGARLDDGNSSTAAGAKLATLLDVVALAANPEQLAALEARIRKVEGEVEAAKQGLERDGYDVVKDPEGDGYLIYHGGEAPGGDMAPDTGR